ncbi:MAG: hypothetical protein US71_C0001G0022 [Parcubacteria group bacterium GW2011_GWD2_38_12]|uniref:EamA domain-containing protein n=1 Tax=Candidatus Azambacteria bacterium RIFCSPLOWO2_01_FULL_37_9 TaxID=1797297 RepID=A0A1F5C790_9BACT|nr:MAG: hypothetical protein US06_C0001G0022 [Parcubacteria group bacterium GW2011_GWC2_36_17]KKQ43891.1 MAG: hypothetical protein US61_C0001G0004 [Parcubacteria group bacterium GW2011_GWE2_37_8]KKQ52819.1 MAG: hypothetical protein US71_C0001G0022 [Parcubacteria group bacterium GW2011_GWD2_38_12]KKQ59023.1 MAG: hypothetical protein US79_C0001G0022 [Parcubacteria group bacterium GW2011_GWC1_38_17]KKQ59243.1 MAG: hypothetical protein US78_C0007G0003 [Parcubacteria group bacterium GW2011_GWD1_38_1
MLKFLLGGIIFATGISWASFAAIVFSVDPKDVGGVGIALFYTSLFLGLSGVLFLLMAYLRNKKLRINVKEMIHNIFRHSILLSVFFVGLLFLHQSNMLNIISVVCLAVFTLAVEIYFLKMNQ